VVRGVIAYHLDEGPHLSLRLSLPLSLPLPPLNLAHPSPLPTPQSSAEARTIPALSRRPG
jgi:hypothetical protein